MQRKILKLFSLMLLSIAVGLLFLFITYFNGSFRAAKELWVTTAMTTAGHQYLANAFASDEEIKEIMDSTRVQNPTENTNEQDIKVPQVQQDSIELINIRTPKYRGYLLKIDNPARVSLSTTPYIGKRGGEVEDLVKQENAIGGVNAGGFSDLGGHGNGGTPEGILISKSKIIYRERAKTYSIVGVTKNNVLVLGTFTFEQIQNMGVRDAVTFGPFLIINGKPLINHGNGGWGIAPRTAIGQTKDGAILLLVIDGRQLTSIGATLKDVQDIFLKYGAENAANLDGGSSTTMYYDGKLINHPSGQHGMRYVPSAFVISR